MTRLLSAWRRHPLLVSSFLLALAVTAFFALRTALFVIYWSDPAHRDQAIAGWMTPGYVAHSWQLPKEKMQAVIGPLPDQQRPTLQAIATYQGLHLSALTARIDAAIAEHRATAIGTDQ